MNFQKRAKLAFGIAMLLGAGCSIPASLVPVMESPRQVAEEWLPQLVPGETKYHEVIAALKKAGVTNIAASQGLASGNRVFRVVSGDGLNRLYFFEGATFQRAVPLRAHRGSDIKLYLKAVTLEGRRAAMVIGPELADERGQIGIVVVANDGNRDAQYATIPFQLFISWKTCLEMPMVQGGTLDTGVFFTARDKNGAAWYGAYPINYVNGRFRVKTEVSIQRLLGCDCARKWYFEPKKWLKEERRAVGLE